MALAKYPSPAHETQRDAYWIARLEPGEDDADVPVILGRRDRRVLELDPVIGGRIVRLLQAVRAGLMRQMAYRCHDVAEYVFQEPGRFREMRMVYPRGEIMGPEQAERRFGLPCCFQFHDPAARHDPVFHSGVLLGIDRGEPGELTASQRAVVLHKPGTFELEIVTLADAVRRYEDRIRDITYYGEHE